MSVKLSSKVYLELLDSKCFHVVIEDKTVYCDLKTYLNKLCACFWVFRIFNPCICMEYTNSYRHIIRHNPGKVMYPDGKFSVYVCLKSDEMVYFLHLKEDR